MPPKFQKKSLAQKSLTRASTASVVATQDLSSNLGFAWNQKIKQLTDNLESKFQQLHMKIDDVVQCKPFDFKTKPVTLSQLPTVKSAVFLDSDTNNSLSLDEKKFIIQSTFAKGQSVDYLQSVTDIDCGPVQKYLQSLNFQTSFGISYTTEKIIVGWYDEQEHRYHGLILLYSDVDHIPLLTSGKQLKCAYHVETLLVLLNRGSHATTNFVNLSPFQALLPEYVYTNWTNQEMVEAALYANYVGLYIYGVLVNSINETKDKTLDANDNKPIIQSKHPTSTSKCVDYKICCWCRKKVEHRGNNPYPVLTGCKNQWDRSQCKCSCCDPCNEEKVIPTRNAMFRRDIKLSDDHQQISWNDAEKLIQSMKKIAVSTKTNQKSSAISSSPPIENL